MKWMIASDLHGSLSACRKMLNRFDAEGAERLLLLGDLLYHGPRNDLPDEYDPKGVISLLNARKEDLLCVRGNCDAEVDQMVLHFPILSDSLLFFVGGHTVFATHGHVFNEENLPPLHCEDALLHGHTHVPVLERRGDWTLLNPGSVAIPKNGSCPSYFTVEDGVFILRALEDGRALNSISL